MYRETSWLQQVDRHRCCALHTVPNVVTLLTYLR
jgi:hypothetical protein